MQAACLARPQRKEAKGPWGSNQAGALEDVEHWLPWCKESVWASEIHVHGRAGTHSGAVSTAEYCAWPRAEDSAHRPTQTHAWRQYSYCGQGCKSYASEHMEEWCRWASLRFFVTTDSAIQGSCIITQQVIACATTRRVLGSDFWNYRSRGSNKTTSLGLQVCPLASDTCWHKKATRVCQKVFSLYSYTTKNGKKYHLCKATD